MKRFPKHLAAAFLALLLISCAGPPQAELPCSPLPTDCWLLQPAIYRLRQSAKLEYQGKTEMLEGFMELDLNRDRAHLMIFNSLGLTLLNIEVERHCYQLANATTKPGDELGPNRRTRQFATAAATAVQHIFFSLESCQKNHYAKTKHPSAEFGGSPPRLMKISENRQNPIWTVTYKDYNKSYDKDPAGRLPGRIILQSRKPDYRLTIWLHKVKLATEVSR